MPRFSFNFLCARAVRRFSAGVCGLLACAAALRAEEPVAKEYQVKAAFLYNFTKFVEWPAGCVGEGEPLVIGVLGHNPFRDELERAVQNRKVNGHSIVVVQLAAGAEPGRVHAVFVPSGEEPHYERWRAALQHEGVLTVGESDRFTALGGVITFLTVDDKIRFEINATAADRSGLKVSAQLLKLATAVQH